MDEDIQLVGLSALMTTTIKSMEETIKALKGAGYKGKVFVGGAVIQWLRDELKLIFKRC